MLFHISDVKIKCFYSGALCPGWEAAEAALMWTVLEHSFRPQQAATYSIHFLACCLEVLGETNVLTWPNENIGNNTLPLRVPLIMYLRLDTRRPL